MPSIWRQTGAPQKFRVRAPCRWTDEFEWHRTGAAVSLGELMRALVKQFSAQQVCFFYRALRIVALDGRRAPSRKVLRVPASL